jgi:amidase
VDDSLAFTPITRQAELIRSGDLTPEELVELYLSRIDALDPQLNAFRIVYRDRARAEAEQAAARLKAGDERPLLGVPLAIKDNVDVAGDVTTHGTSAYGEPAAEDSEVVRRVRAAGAIVIGRTNVPPLCALPVTESPTWGVTRNPWDLDRTPGGSSGGSASAVAAGLVGAALGSDGGGSIRLPSAYCGLFGLKAQRGRVSLAPHPDHWHGMSVVGWLTRTVADSALLYDVTRGPHPVDRDRAPDPARPFTEAAAAEPGPLRIAISFATAPGSPPVKVDEEIRRTVFETGELLRSLGHEVVEATPPMGPEAWAASARVLRGVSDEARSLPRYRRLDRRWKRVAIGGSLISDRLLARARAVERTAMERIRPFFDQHDVLMSPVTPELPIETGRWEGRGTLWTLSGAGRSIPYTAPWNFTGQPAASVPAGLSAGGLPVAVQLVGRPDDEDTLFSLAAQLESARPWSERRPPVS